MKVKVIRMSGNPVETKRAEEFRKEWVENSDALMEKHGKFGPDIIKALDQLEKDLNDKYSDLSIVQWELPKSGKQWIEKLSEYGNIMVSSHLETGELVLVVHDMVF